MNESEIIGTLAKTRGTILCLGLNGMPPLCMFGITDKPSIWPNVLIVPTENRILSNELKCYLKGIDWRIVNHTTDLPINSLMIISSIDQINGYTDYIGLKAYLGSIYRDFNLQAISLVDSFPFHTKEGLHIIDEVREFCREKNVSFRVGLLYGVNKYGSTDISTEDEAVRQEKIFLKKEKKIECIEIDQTLTIDNVLKFFIHDSDALKYAIEKFESECQTTLQSIELMSEILYHPLLIDLNSSLKEYVNFVKNKIQEFDVFFPIVKYLNERFYEDFCTSITIKFNKKKEATNSEVSKWCIDTLLLAIKHWIDHSKLTRKK